jgi:hypothetical protein
MTAEDLVASYCLGAYLMEVYPGRVGALLDQIGNKEQPPAKAFREGLRVELQTVEAKLHAWLKERR